MRLRKGEELVLFWILHKIMEIFFFSGLMFVSATSPLVLCAYNFCFKVYWIICWPNSKKAYSCLIPVGLFEWKIKTAHPILTITFKTSWGWNPQNIQEHLASVQKLDVLVKVTECTSLANIFKCLALLKINRGVFLPKKYQDYCAGSTIFKNSYIYLLALLANW